MKKGAKVIILAAALCLLTACDKAQTENSVSSEQQEYSSSDWEKAQMPSDISSKPDESISPKLQKMTAEQCAEKIQSCFSVEFPKSVKVLNYRYTPADNVNTAPDPCIDSFVAKFSVDKNDVKKLVKSFDDYFGNQHETPKEMMPKVWKLTEETIVYDKCCVIAGKPSTGPQRLSAWVRAMITAETEDGYFLYVHMM